MKRALGLFFTLLFLSFAVEARTGTINVDAADLYKEADFDSEIIQTITKNEKFLVSKKVYNGFYRIKLKSGTLGFIPDHEVVINGVEFQEKPWVDPEDALAEVEKKKKPQKTSQKERKELEREAQLEKEAEEDEEGFGFNHSGVSLQLVNFHEDTMGGIQVDDLLAIGYKSLSETSFEVFASFQAPKYYSEKLNATASGFHLWSSYGINNTLPVTTHGAIRYGAAVMAHLAHTKVAAPTKTYELQDLTAGVVLEGGFLLHFKKASFDFSAKYIFDRNNYGAIGLSLLF